MEPIPQDLPPPSLHDMPQDAVPEALRDESAPAETTLRLGFSGGRVLSVFMICFLPFMLVWGLVVAPFVPRTASGAILAGGLVLLVSLSARRSTIRFTADALIIDDMLVRRRIPWEAVRHVWLSEATDSESGEVTRRFVSVISVRNPDVPLPPVPRTTLGESWNWQRTYLRQTRLPLAFPPPYEDDPLGGWREPRPDDRRARLRTALVREFAARGHRLDNQRALGQREGAGS